MSTFLKIKKKKVSTPSPEKTTRVIDSPTLPAAVNLFTEAMDEISDTLVERGEEIEALKLCIVTSCHLMLEGKHGIGKSMLAEEAFSRITGANVFKKMLMKSTQMDELFGPMNSKKYREDAIWEHNYKGMLPDCHFFFGDEVYRASDQALPALLGILNEREFINGAVRVKCPLMTAIGTTNFTTDSDELMAFHDRWHVRINSQALTAPSSIIKMLRKYHTPPKTAEKATVSLEDIVSLQHAVKAVNIDDDHLELYEQVTSAVSRQMGNAYISDRRKCIGIRFIQASALLDNRMDVNADDLNSARFVMGTVRDTSYETAWNTSYGSVVSTFAAYQAENKKLAVLETWSKKLEARFDDNMPSRQARDLWEECRKGISALSNMSPEEQPKTPQGVARRDTVLRRLEDICDSLKGKVAY